MYRKLVFVLTMFAVAFGSLSQAQAALASPRTPARVASAAHAGTPASIATLRATGAARPATAGRQMAHGARLRTEQKQGSLPLGERQGSPRQSGDRRATGTASAPTTTRAASPAAPKNTRGISAINTACQIFSIPGNATFTVGQSSTVYIFTGLNDYEDFGSQCTFSDGGATLPSGVRFTDTGHNWATLSGTPAAGTAGTYPFTINGSNGGRTVTTLYYTLTVVQACTITSTTDNATFTVGQLGTPVTVTSTGPPTCAWTETGALPTGVTFTDNGDGTATLAGTPAADTGGTYPFTITATNGFGSAATQPFTLTVNQACAITSTTDHATFTVGQAGTPVTFTSNGPPTCAWTETGPLPAGVTFTDNADGTATLAGTPAPGSSGTYPFTITATNSVRPPATQHFTLTVNPAACHITSANGATFTVGLAGTPVTVTTTGYPPCQLSEKGTLPAGVTFTDNGNGTATLSGTPAAKTGGTYTFTITATNVAGYNTQSFTLTVDQACHITSPASATSTVGQAGTITVTTTGVPNCALSESGALPAGVTFTDNGDGTATLTGTPALGTGGTYPFTITAANGIGSQASQAFTLTVSAATPCTITSTTDHATFTVGQAGTPVTFTSNGPPTCAWTETGSLPAGVTFTDNADGTATLAGTPAADTGGRYPFTITATNVAGSDTQTFTLSVLQACQITIPAADTFTAGQLGTPVIVTSTGTPTCTLSETGPLPAGVMFTDNGDGTATLAGTPAPGTGGTYPITITATNGVGSAATQIFPLTVSQACQVTSPTADTFTAGQAGTTTVTTTGVPNCALSESGKLPSGVTFTDNGDGTATLAGTPAPGTGGTYLLTITATNGAGSDTQTFTFSVLQAPRITSAGHAMCTVGQACAFTVRSTGVPTPGFSESGNLPSGVLFTDYGNGRAALAGIPAAGTDGTYRFMITATNVAGSDTQHFTLTVVGRPAAPSGLRATGRGRSVSLTWTNNSSTPSATWILIQRSTNAGFTTGIINTIVSPTATTHIDTTVVKGKRYYYRVRAHNTVGNSAWSNVSSVTAP